MHLRGEREMRPREYISGNGPWIVAELRLCVGEISFERKNRITVTIWEEADSHRRGIPFQLENNTSFFLSFSLSQLFFIN